MDFISSIIPIKLTKPIKPIKPSKPINHKHFPAL